MTFAPILAYMALIMHIKHMEVWSNMQSEKYSVTQYSIGAILGFIEGGAIAIPEIQRPFVWKRRQVRDLIDSLYNGYPAGYLIIWQSPDVKLKDGRDSNGKKILIDGQQRVTALMAAILGYEIIDEDFSKVKIKIAFNPLAEGEEEAFAVQDSSHLKSKNGYRILQNYLKMNLMLLNLCSGIVRITPR